MSDKKISELNASTTPLAGTEVLPIVQSGSTKQVSVANLTSGRSVNAKDLTLAATASQNIVNFQYPTLGTVAGVYLDSGGVYYGSTNLPYNKCMKISRTANNIQFITGGSPKFEIDANNNFVVKTAGAGIDFSADGQAAGMTSELLDDYEEGTFTPTVVGTTTAGTGTYNARTGVYTKVGDTVFFQLWINMSAHTGTGNFRITGLPFVSANIAGVVNAYSGAVGYCTGLAIPADGTVIWYVGQGVSQTDLYRNSISTAVSSAALPLDPASQVQITGWYKAA